jgi:hypothetical protein
MDYAQRLLCGQILASTKKKASTPLHRGSKCVACCTLSWGTGRPPHHMQATTAPPDADSVTLSGKICGSPRSALFHSEPKQKVRKRAALEAIDALNHSPACCPCPPKKMAPTPFRGIDCRDKLHVASVLHQCGSREIWKPTVQSLFVQQPSVCTAPGHSRRCPLWVMSGHRKTSV